MNAVAARPAVPTASVPLTRAEFDALILPHYCEVLRLATALTRDAVEAEDVAQDTYLRAIRGWRTFLRGSSAPRWLLRICRNAFFNRRRAERRFLHDGDIELLAALPAAPESGGEPRSEFVPGVESGSAMDAAIRQLHEPFHTTWLMADVQGMPYREIAALQGVPVGTVCSRVARARAAVRCALVPHAPDAAHDVRRRTTPLGRSASRVRAEPPAVAPA